MAVRRVDLFRCEAWFGICWLVTGPIFLQSWWSPTATAIAPQSIRSRRPMSDNALSLYDDFLRDTGVDRLQKILARYELFKLVKDLPGDIVECGVFKGSGIYTWVKLLQLFRPRSTTRVVGFDFFATDRSAATFRYAEDKECLEVHAEGWQQPDVIKRNCATWGFDRIDLIAGDVSQTTKQFVERALGARIALLYLDLDNYEGTKAVLQNLYPLVVPGGVVVFDEYGLHGYGESNAVEEYFAGQAVELRSLPWAATPSAYMIKTKVLSRLDG
jgi:hypothetical protein